MDKSINCTGLAHIAFSVGSKEEVDEIYRVLKKMVRLFTLMMRPE
jgi:hypothetical protein